MFIWQLLVLAGGLLVPGIRVLRETRWQESFLPPNPYLSPYSCQIVVYSPLVMERVLDVDLVGRAKAGDERALTSLLRPLVGSAYRLAGAMLHDSHAAEDVVQEASLKAWRKLHQMRPGTEMKPWFLGIVANECREMRRAENGATAPTWL